MRWVTWEDRSTPLLAMSNTSTPPVAVVELDELDRVDPPAGFDIEDPDAVGEDEVLDEEGTVLEDEDEGLDPVVEVMAVAGPRTTCACVSLNAA